MLAPELAGIDLRIALRGGGIETWSQALLIFPVVIYLVSARLNCLLWIKTPVQPYLPPVDPAQEGLVVAELDAFTRKGGPKYRSATTYKPSSEHALEMVAAANFLMVGVTSRPVRFPGSLPVRASG